MISSVRKNISIVAYAMLSVYGFRDDLRLFKKIKENNFKDLASVKQFETEYNDPRVTYYSSSNNELWAVIGSFKARDTGSIKILAWGTNTNKYINKRQASNLISQFIAARTYANSNGLESKLKNYMDMKLLPSIDLKLIKFLHENKFTYGSYYQTIDYFKKANNAKKEALSKSFPFSKDLPDYKTVGSSHGIHLLYEIVGREKQPLGWVLLDQNISMDRVRKAIEEYNAIEI